MPVVGCPQCGARVRKPESGRPICPRCGYGKRASGEMGPTRVRSVFGDPRAGGKMDLPITASGRVTSDAGRPRDPVQVLLLMHGTLGVYWLVWLHKAFRELSVLHRRRHPTTRYFTTLVLFPLLPLYLFLEVAQLNEYRKQRNMRPALSVGRFATWYLAGVAAVFLATLVDVLWLPGGWGTAASIAGLVAFLGLSAWMHYETQGSINEIWRDAGVTG